MDVNVILLFCLISVCTGTHIHNDIYAMNQRRARIQMYPFQNYNLSWDVRADDLVSRLTLDEIVNQTIAGIPNTPGITRLGINAYPWDTECLHGLVHTNATGFPQSLGLAASFSEELLFNISEAISYEARGHWNGYRKQGIFSEYYGLSCFSPTINIMRHPLWGRNQETYGEDPFLSGKLVQNFVRGLQGNDPRYVRANAGCKHFDVHGGPEDIPSDRMSFDSKVSMRDWRMTFLPQFKMCVEAGTYSMMCSFNSINGIPACANKQLMTDIARTEWGFKGYIVSDAGAVSNIIYAHHYLKTEPEAAAASILAGCNLELGSEVFKAQIDAMKLGLITEDQLRQNVRPLMYTRLRLGEFDPDGLNPYSRIPMEVVQSEKHRNLAAVAASMSFVLLKNNDNLLPIKTVFNKISVVGPFARDTSEIMGSYSSDAIARFIVPLYEGLSRLAKDTNVGPGCTNVYCSTYDATSVQLAVEDTDMVFVALGTGRSIEGEGSDRSNIDLPGKQLQLLMDAVAFAKGKPVILLLFNAGPLDITWAKWNNGVGAILECFFPGQATGDAVYATLTASNGPRSVPAARLPATWPSFLNQVPSMTDYNMAGHTYRYFDGEPLYPFGYGLSYSSFLYTSLLLSPSTTLVAGQNLTATIGVLNTGDYDADEVVQVYLTWPTTSPFPVPRLQLVAFTRLTLRRGEQQLVELVITSERMAVWGDNEWTFIKGVCGVYAGGQQPNQRTTVQSNVLHATFTLI